MKNADITITPFSQDDIKFLNKLSAQRNGYFLFEEILDTSLYELNCIYGDKDIPRDSYVIGCNGKKCGIISLKDMNTNAGSYYIQIIFDESKGGYKKIMGAALKKIANALFLTENVSKIMSQLLPREKLIADILTENNFKLEASLRGNYYDLGKYEDVLIFGLLKDDFKQGK
ncbi:MAG: GNAT family N-acetyltransferase [Endomicrobium sp.]|nr:GNAT family N-acetyltransferase [Endomicrobium sp.]